MTVQLEGIASKEFEARAAGQGRWAWGTEPVARALELASIMSAQYHECRLGADQGQVDYLVAFSRAAAAALSRRLSGSWLDGPLPERRRALGRLVGAWAGGRSVVSAQSPTFWLEFDDCAATSARAALPSVSVCLVPAYRGNRPLNGGDSARGLATALDALGHLGVQESGSPEELRGCFEGLPDGARWIHLSVMLGRTPSALKLYGAFPRKELLPYLDRIGWAGDARAIERIMGDVYGASLLGEQVFVDLNLDTFRDVGRCTLGLAVTPQHLVQGPAPESDRRRILDRWIAAGLCTEEQAADVKSWVNRAGGDTVEGGMLRPFLDLKLVWQAGRSLQAKAYLGVHQAGLLC